MPPVRIAIHLRTSGGFVSTVESRSGAPSQLTCPMGFEVAIGYPNTTTRRSQLTGRTLSSASDLSAAVSADDIRFATTSRRSEARLPPRTMRSGVVRALGPFEAEAAVERDHRRHC